LAAEGETKYFDYPGEENRIDTLKLAYQRAKELHIKEIVVATSSGETAEKALDICKDMKIVAVSYHAGFQEPFKLSIPEKTRKELAMKGVKVICATHALSGVERGLAKKIPGPYPVMLIAETLRLFGQGTKVAIEVAIMAADSGNLSGDKIIAVGGTGKGCDTALVLTPACQSDFFNLKIHEIICKPNLYKGCEE
jgi:uncharacterized protein